VVVQPGNADLVSRFRTVHELAWGQRVTIEELTIESTAARHWGARMITDRHRGYGGYLLQKAGRTVLFAGDTAFTDLLTHVGRRAKIDLAILPIGAYDPWIHNHASPEQAWHMFKRLGAEYVLPVHHSTFRLSREPVDEPIRRFLAAAGEEQWRVVAREIGDSWTLAG
jgi:L-ascorbate metabolism protein UlaG (beta-lactamase superfamily)